MKKDPQNGESVQRAGDSMRYAAAAWRGQFFQMRQWDRRFFLASDGLWIYPALVREGNAVLWLHLMFGVQPAKRTGLVYVMPPRAVVWTQPDTCAIERYERLRDMDSRRPIGIYPWRALQRITVREFAAAETNLMLAYPHAQRVFAESRGVPADFARLYRQINHPAALTYLRDLAPAFAAALHGNPDV